MLALLLGAVVLMAVSAFSGPLSARGVSPAMAYVLAGIVFAVLLGGTLGLSLETSAVHRVAELALVFLLFTDAARLDPGVLRSGLSWPGRLLLFGLPLSLLLGFGAALLLFPGLSLASAFLLSAMLCATDAVLGLRVVEDPAVPVRVRQALNVESGLNDGIAVPFFLVSLDISMSTLDGSVPSAIAVAVAEQIGFGLVAGIVVGAAGGLLLRMASGRGWLEAEWRQPFTLAVAMGTYALAVSLGGSAFLAAFVAGMAFRRAAGAGTDETMRFTSETGNVLAAATWLIFGAVAVPASLPYLSWEVFLYAALSLTAVRMLPVAAAMAGSHARWQTRAFMGWFGPRGLASVVFALLAYERGTPDASILLTAVVVTVALSVFAHGLTARPLVAAYHDWSSGRAQRPPRTHGPEN